MHRTADITMEDLAKLKRVGFWKSDREPSLPDPRALVDQGWDATERERVISYLESSFYIPVAQGGPSWCRFGCSPRPRDIGSQDLTDGTWVFPEGFAHYVRFHGVKPPAEFLEHMGQLDFRVATLPVLCENGELPDCTEPRIPSRLQAQSHLPGVGDPDC
jgi:hypothetical protein